MGLIDLVLGEMTDEFFTQHRWRPGSFHGHVMNYTVDDHNFVLLNEYCCCVASRVATRPVKYGIVLYLRKKCCVPY